MPTKNPRLTITLKPATAALMQRMSEVTGQSQSSLIAELLETNEPVFERLIKVLQAAEDAKAAFTAETRAGLHQAQEQIEAQLGLVLEAMDTATAPILAEAEQVKRRTRKRAGDTRSPRGARPLPGAPAAVTPPSNRGVRSRNPKAKVRKTRGG